MGETKRPFYKGFERVYAEPSLNEKFPPCLGGIVTGEKEGYFSTKLQIDTSTESAKNNNKYFNLEMIKTKKFKLDEMSTLVIYGGTQGSRLRDEEDGSMFISIKNKEYGFESTAIWPTEEGILDTLEFLDLPGISYELSAVFIDTDYELRGIFDLEEWTPDIHSGNQIKISIPAAANPITEENFLDFYETSNSLIRGEIGGFSQDFGVHFE